MAYGKKSRFVASGILCANHSAESYVDSYFRKNWSYANFFGNPSVYLHVL